MGKVVASYQVRITLRERDPAPAGEPESGDAVSKVEPPEPTNAEIEELIGDALYDGLAYYTADVIHVTSERLDR